MKKLTHIGKNLLLWSYERATWQYDLLVALIIATVFFVPGQYFGDRDRPLRTLDKNVERRWSIEPNKINSFAARSGNAETLKHDPREVVQLYLREVIRPGIEVADCQVETDTGGRVTGYSVWFQ